MNYNSRGFVNQVLLCVLVTIGFGGSIGLGTVWTRHRISETANRNRELAAELKRIERLIDEKQTVIETEQAPAKLRALNDNMSLGLVLMNEVPVQTVTVNVTERMAARAHREIFTDRAPAATPPIAFKIAQR
jgi:hypothetical protein